MKRRKFKPCKLDEAERRIEGIGEKYKDIVLERVKIVRFLRSRERKQQEKYSGLQEAPYSCGKKKLKDKEYRPLVLIPGSRAPIRRRRKEWHPEAIEYIIKRRWESPRLGQKPLKRELDEFCKKRGIKPISASTIVRIVRCLKDKGEILDPKAKVSFYARTGRLVVKIKSTKRNYLGKGMLQLSLVILFRWTLCLYL